MPRSRYLIPSARDRGTPYHSRCRWREANESQSGFVNIGVRQRPRRAIEEVVSSHLGTEPDRESEAVARSAALIPLRPRRDDFCCWFCRRGSLAVLRQWGENDDRWLVPLPWLVGAAGRQRFLPADESGSRGSAAKPRQARQ